MHVVIMKPPTGLVVDHADNDGLNNLRSNLRICTRSQNSANRISVGGSSIYLGVSYYKKNKKWGALIGKNRKQIFIGLFETEEQAAIAYNKSAILIHGEFAKLNNVT